MIRIVYIIDSLVAGGLEHQTTALVAGLDRSRFDPHVVHFYGERAGRSLHFAPRLHDAGVPVHSLDLTYDPLSKARALLGIVRWIRRLRPQIVHTVNYHGNILIGYARPFLPLRTRLVVSVRSENTRKQLLTQQLSWRICSRITCNSPHLVDELVTRSHLPRRKILHIPNGLNLQQFQDNPDPTFCHQIAPQAEHVLLKMTRITPRKAPQLLVQALGLLRTRDQLPAGTRAFIVGERENAHTQAQIDAALDRYDLRDVVTQYPQTDQPARFYHAADVTVLCALFGEGLPNVILESLAAGRPVIVSEAGNRVGVIEPGKTGWLFRTGDAEHLAETLRIALTTPEPELEKMRAACRAVAQQYGMDKMIARHQALYEQIMHGRHTDESTN